MGSSVSYPPNGVKPPHAGTYTYATLPSASSVQAGTRAYTTDYGPVYSDGTAWQLTLHAAPPPNGIDDSDALRAAITAAAGQRVVLHAGTYLLSRDGATTHCIEIPSGTEVVGQGMGITVLKAAPSLADGVSVVALEAGGSNFRIADLTIDGTRARSSTIGSDSENIHGSGLSGVAIERVESKEALDEAIDLDDSSNVLISQCNLHDNNGNGVHLAGATGGAANKVVHCRFDKCGFARQAAGYANAAAIDLVGGPHQVTGLTITDCVAGIIGSGSQKIIVSDCDVQEGSTGAMTKGISVGANSEVHACRSIVTSSIVNVAAEIVRGGQISGGTHGVDAQGARPVVSGAKISGTTTAGVRFNGTGILSGVVEGCNLAVTSGNTVQTVNTPANIAVVGNAFFGGNTDMSSGSGHIRRHNSGQISEAFGTNNIADGASTRAVSHGMYTTPTAVAVTTQGNEAVWVSARSSTTFTVSRSGTSGVLNFDWFASKS